MTASGGLTKREMLDLRPFVEQAATGRVRQLSGGGRDAAGLSSEGYDGGYAEAVRDVEAMLRHGCPSDTRRYWQSAQLARNVRK